MDRPWRAAQVGCNMTCTAWFCRRGPLCWKTHIANAPLARALLMGKACQLRRERLWQTGSCKNGRLICPRPRNWGCKALGPLCVAPLGRPRRGSGNVTLTPGSQSREDLIRDMGTGLLLTSLIGASINATTGDYSRGASGFWVENGEIAYPVNECTIAGNLREMLQNIVPANDGRAHLSRVVPSVLVPSMAIAGE